MSDQVQSPEAGAQPQETTSGVENPTPESLGLPEGSELPQEQEPQEKEPPHQKVVPLAALHEEREEKKRLKQQMRTMEERFNQLSQVVTQRMQQPKPEAQAAEIPSVEVDAVGHFKARTEALERRLEELSQPVQEMRQQTEQEKAVNALRQHVSAQEAQFAQATPDYADALRHMQNITRQGIRALGYDEQTTDALLHREYLNMAHRIASQGENVAAAIYEAAKANGYTPKSQGTEQDKLAALKKGTAAARSLGGGGNVTGKLSLAALAEMPADEFAKTIGDEDAWRKLWG